MAAQSHACCTVPPVQIEGYDPKGKHITVAGMDTYATGPSTAKKGILIVFDIFAFFPQTYQGADILASGDSESNYQVFMPDFFDGKPAELSWYPPKDDDSKQKLGEFFQTTGSPQKAVSRIPQVIEELKKSTGIQTWGLVGFCWGAKVANLCAQEGTLFKAVGVAHPAMVDPKDAPGVTVPYIMLPSGDEDKEAVNQWEQGLKVPHAVHFFDDQVHGWLAARGDLTKEYVRQAYERGYKLILDFFHEHV